MRSYVSFTSITWPSPSITRSGRSVIACSFSASRQNCRRVGLRSISPAQQRPGRAGGEAAVTDALLLPIRELAERPAQRREEEDGIVSEAAGAARCRRNLAFGEAIHRALAVLVDQGDDAPKA